MLVNVCGFCLFVFMMCYLCLINLFHEGVGQTVLVAMKTGEEYRGTLLEAEDCMNCQLKDGTLY